MSDDYRQQYDRALERIQSLERSILVAVLLIERGQFADAQSKLARALPLPERDDLLSPARESRKNDE
jgi:hypothetical protein